MALLQVHQVKALRNLHEGGHDPQVLQELRAATDLTLPVTGYGAVSESCDVHSGGPEMPSLAVSGRHEGYRQSQVP